MPAVSGSSNLRLLWPKYQNDRYFGALNRADERVAGCCRETMLPARYIDFSYDGLYAGQQASWDRQP